MDEPSQDPDSREEAYVWKARNVRPVVLLYVAGVFAGFMALAQFVLHSGEAVKALALTAVGALAPLVPVVRVRTEYRLTESGLDKRPSRTGTKPPFEEVFRWEDLGRLVPTATGFKFYKRLDEPRRLRRFWKMHVGEEYSGEFHVEGVDRLELEEKLARRGALPPGR